MSLPHTASAGDGLTPLPNTFDPDSVPSASTIDVTETKTVDDHTFHKLPDRLDTSPPIGLPKDDDLESLTADDTTVADAKEDGHVSHAATEAEEGGHIDIASNSPRELNGGRVEVGEEIVETEEDRPEMNSDLFGFLKSIQDTGEDEEEGKGDDEEREAGMLFRIGCRPGPTNT